ncbi:uncharacterized protein [Drosophila virilis]|uniref:uncharacterized protein n=1 Tax=Drosophila virilis TaxID=7244 RepID=UPI0038B3DF95
MERLQLLRSCLSGPALDLVRSLEFSGANYPVALDILNRRFSNKRLVSQAHINEILGLKRVDSESATKLHEFSEKVNSHMRALQNLGSLEQISGCIIVHTLLQRLDTQTHTKWKEAAGIDKIPTADEFFTFLERRSQRLESVQHAMSSHITNYQPVRAMHQLAFDERDAFPIGSDAIKQGFTLTILYPEPNQLLKPERKFIGLLYQESPTKEPNAEVETVAHSAVTCSK